MDAPSRIRVTDLSRIEQQLAEMWRDVFTKDESIVRATKFNLIVACADSETDLLSVGQSLARLCETEPGRALVVVPPPVSRRGGSVGIEAWVSTHCHRLPSGGHACSEQVTIEETPESGEALESMIRSILVQDLPVYSWWRRRIDQDAPLLARLRGLSDCLIVDGASFDDPAPQLARLHRLETDRRRNGSTVDLAWLRLEPWREAVASFFDVPSLRGRLEGLTKVEIVSGGPASRGVWSTAALYLTGWLATRLGWSAGARPTIWHLEDGGEIRVLPNGSSSIAAGTIGSLKLSCTGNGMTTVFSAERLEDDYVRLSVEAEDACPVPQRLRLPHRDDSRLLCGVVQLHSVDPVFDETLDLIAGLTLG